MTTPDSPLRSALDVERVMALLADAFEAERATSAGNAWNGNSRNFVETRLRAALASEPTPREDDWGDEWGEPTPREEEVAGERHVHDGRWCTTCVEHGIEDIQPVPGEDAARYCSDCDHHWGDHPDGWVCRADDCDCIGFAIRSAPSGGLDVERLAEALIKGIPGFQRWLNYSGPISGNEARARVEAVETDARTFANVLAREYAALASPSPDPEEPDAPPRLCEGIHYVDPREE